MGVNRIFFVGVLGLLIAACNESADRPLVSTVANYSPPPAIELDLGTFLLHDAYTEYWGTSSSLIRRVWDSFPAVDSYDGRGRVLRKTSYALNAENNDFNVLYPWYEEHDIASMRLDTGTFSNNFLISLSSVNYHANDDGSITWSDSFAGYRSIRYVMTEGEDLSGTPVNQAVQEDPPSGAAVVDGGEVFSAGARRYRITATTGQDHYGLYRTLYAVNAQPFTDLDQIIGTASTPPFTRGVNYWSNWWVANAMCLVYVTSVSEDGRSGRVEYAENRVARPTRASSTIQTWNEQAFGVGDWKRVNEYGKDMIVFTDIPKQCAPHGLPDAVPFIALNDVDGHVAAGLKVPKGAVYGAPDFAGGWVYNGVAAGQINALLSAQ